LKALFLVLIVLSCFLFGCDNTESFTFENSSTVRVHVFTTDDTSERSVFSLEPGERRSLVTAERFWRGRVVARDDAGDLVFDEHVSWEELVSHGGVVITQVTE